jgi:uncharacterized protein YdeI (YjbR/CyaY-like superfamily)
MKPLFFARSSDFRTWLRKHHRTEKELLVGFYKVGTGRPSITWPQSVDQALCFGWIDGIRKSVDSESYSIRFTPRKQGSHWSAINIRRVKELTRLGLMRKAGLEAFAQRTAARSQKASYEQRSVALDPRFERQLHANESAWRYFEARPPYYRRQCVWWIMSAKKEETRDRRLAVLIESSANGQLIPPFRRTARST